MFFFQICWNNDGISNTLASLPGMIAPSVTSALTPHVSKTKLLRKKDEESLSPFADGTKTILKKFFRLVFDGYVICDHNTQLHNFREAGRSGKAHL